MPARIAEGQILLWRDSSRLYFDSFKDPIPIQRPEVCPWCSTPLKYRWHLEEIGLGEYHSEHFSDCSLCGWRLWTYSGDRGMPESEQACKILRTFDINSEQVAIDELGSHLRKHFSDIYSLDWRRFEVLAADVFRRHGHDTLLTCTSSDGGADVLILQPEGSSAPAIVECKRYAADRTIGVSLVRTLVGAAVEWDAKQAYLVTTSDFTRGAKLYARTLASRGYAISLVGASSLLEMLSVYNSALPSLDKLNEDARRELIALHSVG